MWKRCLGGVEEDKTHTLQYVFESIDTEALGIPEAVFVSSGHFP